MRVRSSLAVLAVSGLALIPAAANAADFNEPGNAAFVAVGETFMLDENHPYFAGKFSGAFVPTGQPGRFANASLMCPGYNDVGKDAAGYCLFTAGNGDKALGHWICAAVAPPAGAILAGDCTMAWVSGTGGLKGIGGSAKYQALILAPNADGTTSGLGVYSAGLSYTLP